MNQLCLGKLLLAFGFFLFPSLSSAQDVIDLDSLEIELDEARTASEELEYAQDKMDSELYDVELCSGPEDCAWELEEAQDAIRDYENAKDALEYELEDLDPHRY